MTRPRPPYLQRHVTRHGKVVWYVHKRGGPFLRIRAPYGSAAFAAEYQAAIEGKPLTGGSKAGRGTLAWLVERYKDSQPWEALSKATRRQRDSVLKNILANAGHEPFADITRKVVVAGIDRRRATPAAARHFLEALRGVFKWAVSAEIAETDPTTDIKAPRAATEGHAVWQREWIETYRARWPLGTRERLAMELLYCTGLRRGDAVRVGRQHTRDGVIRIKTEKTGEWAIAVITQELADAIAAGPCGDLAYISGAQGPLTKESFGNCFREWCAAAKVPGSAHGLRKARATHAAEAGATEHELMAAFAWDSPRTAAIYTRKANRDRLALQVGERLKSNKG